MASMSLGVKFPASIKASFNTKTKKNFDDDAACWSIEEVTLVLVNALGEETVSIRRYNRHRDLLNFVGSANICIIWTVF